jgi:hypothetical protein
MKNEVADNPADDVAQAIEQLRAAPEEPIEASAEELGARIADKLDAEDDARASATEPVAPKRDKQTGRFASTGAPSGDDANNPVAADQQTGLAAAAAGPPQAPTSWSREAKAAFSLLSPAVKDAVLKREREVSDGFRNLSQGAKDLDAILGPRRQSLSRFGFKSDGEVINHMMLWSDALQRDPAQAITDLANYLGVRLGQAQSQPQMTAAEARDLEDAKRQVAAFEARPPEHYSVVRDLMKGLLERGQANDMNDAYNKAMGAVRSIYTARGSVARKVAATNASLTGAPHGVGSSNGKSKHVPGSFHDVTDDVRAALAQLR